MTAYLALLRGINVGAANRIRMEEIKRIFEYLGFSCVETFLQSGNVLFHSDRSEAEIVRLTEQSLFSQAGIQTNVIVRSAEELTQTVLSLPLSWRQHAAESAGGSGKADIFVCFTAQPPDPAKLCALSSPSAEGDEYVIIGRDVYLLLYQSIRTSKLAIRLQKSLAPVTVRNWNVVCQLHELSDARQHTLI